MQNSVILAILLIFILLFGCTATTQNPKEKLMPKEQLFDNISSANITNQSQSYIKTEENGNVTKVTIESFSNAGKNVFPLQKYPKQFERVGLYSEDFIRLNKSQIKTLAEGEEIWLTPGIRRDGKGVLSNAIYSRYLNADCSDKNITILGKTYDITKLNQNAAFEKDDKWKVIYEYKDYTNTCKTKIIIAMNGYFEGLEEGEQISLFRNDNTVLLSFKDLNSTELPKVGIIYTNKFYLFS